MVDNENEGMRKLTKIGRWGFDFKTMPIYTKIFRNVTHHYLSDQIYRKHHWYQLIFLNFHIKLYFLTTYYITNTLEEVTWNEESWLYKKYVLKEKN